MKRSKRFSQVLEKVDSNKKFDPSEALTIVKDSATAKFDETVEIHFNLGIDPRHADQQIRGTIVLPHGTGKTTRILVLTQGENATEAKSAGADFIGDDDLIEKIQGGWLDFDVVIASPDMMPKVGKLGRILGARGMMPNPKTGTVTTDIAKAVREFKAGKVEYRNDKTGLIHLGIGKASFGLDQLKDNFKTIYDEILRVKPTKSKGIYLKSISVCPTMGPSVQIEPLRVKWKGEQ